MIINTNGEKDYHTDLYERTAERFGVGTKSGGIDAACKFSIQMLPTLRGPSSIPILTEKLAEILSTEVIEVKYEIDVTVR